MVKHLRLLLSAAIAILWGSAIAQTNVTWTVTATSGIIPDINMDENITLTWSTGNGDTAPRYSTYGKGTPVANLGANNVVTIAAANDKKITKVVFTFKGDNIGISTCDISGKTSTMSSEGITTSYFDDSSTWAGEATTINFGSSGRRYITSITVTYVGEEPVELKADLSITSANPASSVDMTKGATTYVNYKNLGDAASENTAVNLYVDGVINNTVAAGAVNPGAAGFKSISYNMESITAGDHEVYLAITADNDDAEGSGVKQTTVKTVNFYTPVVAPTYTVTAENVEVEYDATSYTVVAQVTNTNNVAKEDVKVQLLSGATVMAETTVNVPANETAVANLIVENGPFEVNTYEMQVVANNQAQKWINVVVKPAPIIETKDLAIIDITGTLDLANATNDVRVTVENRGNVDITDATVTLKAAEKVLGTATVSAKAEQQGWCYITVASEGLEAGELEVTAIVEVEGDAVATDNTAVTTLTVKAAPVPEATYSISADDVNVEYGAESFDIVATLTNTSDVDAAEVSVTLLKGITEVDSKVIPTLAAGASTNVTFTIQATDEVPFEAGTTATYYVQAPKNQALAEVTVTFEEAPIVEVVDVELTAIQGISNIDLAAGVENTVTLWAFNAGNVAADVTFSVKLNETVLESKVVNVMPEQNGYATFVLPTEGLEVGQTATMTATITVADNINTATSQIRQYEVVNSDIVAEPVLSVAVEDVTALLGEGISVKVTVSNTSEVDATGVEVKIVKGLTDIDSQTIAELKAGASTDVIFEIPAVAVSLISENAGVFELMAIAGKSSDDFTLTLNERPIVQKVDLAVTAVTGTLSTEVETNYLTIFVENMGTVDATDAPVTVKAGDKVLGTGIVSPKAGNSALCSIAVAAEDLIVGEFEVTVSVAAQYDVDTENNTVVKTYTIVASAIGDVKAQQELKNAPVFTLDGKRVSHIKKGTTYIINGKKMRMK